MIRVNLLVKVSFIGGQVKVATSIQKSHIYLDSV